MVVRAETVFDVNIDVILAQRQLDLLPVGSSATSEPPPCSQAGTIGVSAAAISSRVHSSSTTRAGVDDLGSAWQMRWPAVTSG